MTKFDVFARLQGSFVDFIRLHFKNIGLPFVALEVLVEKFTYLDLL